MRFIGLVTLLVTLLSAVTTASAEATAQFLDASTPQALLDSLRRHVTTAASSDHLHPMFVAGAPSSLRKLMETDPKDEATVLRHFNALQSTSSTSSSTNSGINEACKNDQAFLNDLKSYTDKCQSYPIGLAIFAIAFTDPYSENSTKGTEALCRDSCMTGYIDLIKRNVKCFTADGMKLGYSLDLLCATDPSTKSVCAVEMKKISSNCFGFDQAGCEKRSAVCGYNATAKTCNSQYSNAALAQYCGGFCLRKSLTLLADKNVYTNQDGLEARMGMEAMCLKVDSTYCLAAVTAMDSSFTSALISTAFASSSSSNSALSSYCSNSTMRKCVRAYMSYGKKTNIISSQKQLKSCLESAAKITFESTRVSSANFCIRTYGSTLISYEKIDIAVGLMCATTTGTETGDKCLSVWFTQSNDATVKDCSTKAQFLKTCTSTCDSTLKGVLDKLGCCAFPIGRLNSIPRLDDALIPKNANFSKLSFVNLTNTPTEPFSEYDACSSTAVARKAITRCQPAQAAEREVKTVMSYKQLSKDPALMSNVLRSMRQDVAAAMYVGEEAITSDSLVEDTTRKVNVASSSTSRKQQATSSVAEPAANYKFTVVADTAQQQQDATSAFDQKVASGSLSTTSTSNAVASCTTCTDVAASPVNGIGPTTTTTAAPGASGPSVGSCDSSCVGAAVGVVVSVVVLVGVGVGVYFCCCQPSAPPPAQQAAKDPNATGSTEPTAVAAHQLPDPSYVFDASSGYYYSEESGYFWDATSGQFFDSNSNMWYDPATGTWS